MAANLPCLLHPPHMAHSLKQLSMPLPGLPAVIAAGIDLRALEFRRYLQAGMGGLVARVGTVRRRRERRCRLGGSLL